MKIKFILHIFLCLCLFTTVEIHAQEMGNYPEKTPEQEAVQQTSKLQQELDLNAEQVKKIYEINLRYAKQRQSATKRSEAMELLKKKDGEIENALGKEKYQQLQNKRNERISIDVSTTSGMQNITPSYRSTKRTGNTNLSLPERNLRRSNKTSEGTVEQPKPLNSNNSRRSTDNTQRRTVSPQQRK
jgi:hypothetical protein